jgi:PAS domain S-box-containing protein
MSDRSNLFTCEDAIAFVGESAVGHAIVDSSGCFVAVNDAYCRALLRVREQIIGKPFSEFTHPDDLEVDETNAKKVAAGEVASYTFRKRYIQAGGTPKKELTIWGTLTVRGCWESGKFLYYRVTFVPLVQTGPPTQVWFSRENLQRTFTWLVENKKTLLAGIALAASISGASWSTLSEVLRRAKETKQQLDSVLPESSSSSPAVSPAQSSPP